MKKAGSLYPAFCVIALLNLYPALVALRQVASLGVDLMGRWWPGQLASFDS